MSEANGMDYPTFIAETARMTGNHNVAYPTDRCSETSEGAVIAPSTILNPDVATYIRRIVFDSDGQVLDHGRTQRRFGQDFGTGRRFGSAETRLVSGANGG